MGEKHVGGKQGGRHERGIQEGKMGEKHGRETWEGNMGGKHGRETWEGNMEWKHRIVNVVLVNHFVLV